MEIPGNCFPLSSPLIPFMTLNTTTDRHSRFLLILIKVNYLSNLDLQDHFADSKPEAGISEICHKTHTSPPVCYNPKACFHLWALNVKQLIAPVKKLIVARAPLIML